MEGHDGSGHLRRSMLNRSEREDSNLIKKIKTLKEMGTVGQWVGWWTGWIWLC